jgi:hypothetical protein
MKIDFEDCFECQAWMHSKFRRTKIEGMETAIHGTWFWVTLTPCTPIATVVAITDKLENASFEKKSMDKENGNHRYAWIPKETRKNGVIGHSESMTGINKIVKGVNGQVTPTDRKK